MATYIDEYELTKQQPSALQLTSRKSYEELTVHTNLGLYGDDPRVLPTTRRPINRNRDLRNTFGAYHASK